MQLNHIEAERLLLTAPSWVEERFRGKIDYGGPIPNHRPELGPCWIWTGDFAPNGYGRFRFQRQRIRAHRAALVFAGVDVGDRRALHHCDTRPCVRPSHLFAGTLSDNSKDAKTKGRLRRAGWKFDAESAAEIRRAVAAGESQVALAMRYGTSRFTINDIVRGRTWAKSL